ncbi:MAG: hypothetical protein ACT4OP_02570 [Actinomycetota bacterium]
MGQQPNVPITRAHQPRLVPEPDPPRRRRPVRPGLITSPEETKWGGAFGTPGPDTGYALRLLKEADLPERSARLEKVLAALMAARASGLGRAPIGEDLEVALIVSGFGEGLPDQLVTRRRHWVDATAHERSPGQTAVAEVDPHLLIQKPGDVRRRLRIKGE